MELDFGTGENVYLLGDIYYYPVNLAARTIPFVIYRDPASGTGGSITINGKVYYFHNQIIRLPIDINAMELTDPNSEPVLYVHFSVFQKDHVIKAYLGTQMYVPQIIWPWSFRWTKEPPYYFRESALSSFKKATLRSDCGILMVIWINECGQMLGLPVRQLNTTAEGDELEMVSNKTISSQGSRLSLTLSRTPAGATYETVRFSTPPLTADDVHTFCSLGSARYVYLKHSGSLMPIEVNGSFSWSAVGTGECATFSAKIYSKNVTYVNG